MNPQPQHPARADDPTRYCLATRPRCTSCSSPDVRFYKTIQSEDGQVLTRYTICRRCGKRFLTISE